MQSLRRTDPRSVGNYRLLGRIGSGGMGVVYLGESRAGAHVAIKVVKPELAEDPEFRARFNREATAAGRVRSPYTAPVVDADVTAAQPWLATEYIPGPSLSKLVGRYGPLRHDDLVATGEQIASALVAIHAAGLVHRDVKPGNILMSPDGPRVIDFGIACALESAPLTKTGVTLGSPGFLSPEQVRGSAVTAASDVFSLGATLVHAATGRSAFGTGPADALLYRVVHERADLDGVPPALAKLLATCLAKEPAARPTAAEFRARLHARARAVERARASERARVLGRRGVDRPPALTRLPATTRPPTPVSPPPERERAAEVGADRLPERPARPERPERVIDRLERAGGAGGVDRGVAERPTPARLPARPRPAELTARPRPLELTADRPRPAEPSPRPPGVPPGAGQDGVPTLRRPTGPSRRTVMRRRALVALAAIATLVFIATHPPFRLGAPARPKPAPSRPAAPTASAAADVAPTTRFEPAGAVPAVDWASAAYPAPDGGNSVIALSGGLGVLGGRAVTLSQALPVTFQQQPAEVVVLNAPSPAQDTQFVYVYALRGRTPTVLSAASMPLTFAGDRAVWRLDDGLLTREETSADDAAKPRASAAYAPTVAGALVPAAP